MSSVLTITNLNKHFGAKVALKDINFELAAGRVIGLVGPNGAGKSTLMKAILGLVATDSGQVSVFGQNVTLSQHQTLDRVGALIEYPAIYPFMTGRQHLELFATDDNSANLDAVVQQLDMGGYINAPAKGYSLGMKQKLGIALAVLNNPELVILDEPMNGLDPQATKQVREMIQMMRDQGKTVLISSHILSELEKVIDDIIVLDHGEIVRNEAMTAMNAESQDFIIIHTDNDTAAKTALTAAGIQLVDEPSVKLLNVNQPLPAAIKALVAANIEVVDVLHEHNDLEANLLNVLRTDAVGAK